MDIKKEVAEKVEQFGKIGSETVRDLKAKATAFSEHETTQKVAGTLWNVEKGALSKTGMGLLGGAALFGIYAAARKHRKGEIAPRRRRGRVSNNPRGYGAGEVSGVSMMGVALLGTGILAKGLPMPVRAALSLGGAVAMGLGLNKSRRTDPSVAALGMATAGAAAIAAYSLISKHSPEGLGALKSFLVRHSPGNAVKGAVAAAASVRKTFPGISKYAIEGGAMAAGVVTMPMAHSIMVKHLAAEQRRTTDHGDTSFMAAMADHKAGYEGMRNSNAPKAEYDSRHDTSVNFSGSVKSYYDNGLISNMLSN